MTTIRVNTGKGGGASGTDDQLEKMVQGQSAMTKNLLKIAGAVSVTAIIWKGLEPILTPLIKLLSLIALVVFLPLLPYIKDMAKKLSETAISIKEGQTGDSPGGAFVGGLGALVEDASWVAVGAIIGAALLTFLSTGAIIGALSLLIGTSLVFTKLGKGEVENAVAAAGILGLTAGIATFLLTGSPIAAAVIGLITYKLASEIIMDEITLDYLKEVFIKAGIIALVAAGFAGFFFGAAGFIIAGSITFIISTIWQLMKGKPDPLTEFEKFGQGTPMQTFEIPAEFELDMDAIIKDIENTNKEWVTFNDTVLKSTTLMTTDLKDLGTTVGDEGKDYSLVTNLSTANNEWTEMGINSNNQINGIVNNLSRIPRKIVTTHVIRTVRE